MFKRVTTFLTVLFMGLVLTVRSPVKADTFSIPFSSIPDLINAFYTIAAGGKIEFSTLIGQVTGIDDFLSGLNNYYETHYTPEGTVAASQFLQDQLSILSLLGGTTIDDSGQVIFSANAADIANFAGYDVNWINRYTDSNAVVEHPDPNYTQYIDLINGSGFFFRDWTYTTLYPQYTNINLTLVPARNYSWLVFTESGITNSIIQTNGTNYWSSNTCDITSVYINQNVNGKYRYYYGGTCTLNFTYFGNNYNSALYRVVGGENYVQANYRNMGTFTFSSDEFNTLQAAFEDLSHHARNVDIYVDGILWDSVRNLAPAISLNDSVIMGDTDQITYNTYPIDGIGDNGIDLYNWAQSLYDYVVSNPDGTLTMDTVIEGEWDIVDNDTDDGTITQEDEEDIYKVIHGNLVTSATPTPTPDIGDPPILKIIPPILDLPDEIWPDGGRDTTVLAQMVHATDVAMPNDLMTIIWSTIGLLVVGGLISILHK